MKWVILKWIVQFLLASLLSLLSERYLVNGGMGGIVIGIMIFVPLTVSLGIVIGDLSLYRGQKFSVLAVIVALLLGCASVILWFYFIDLSKQYMILAEGFVAIVLDYGIKILPPLIGYNTVSFLSRKLRSKRQYQSE